jgi:hypothetical protein
VRGTAFLVVAGRCVLLLVVLLLLLVLVLLPHQVLVVLLLLVPHLVLVVHSCRVDFHAILQAAGIRQEAGRAEQGSAKCKTMID